MLMFILMYLINVNMAHYVTICVGGRARLFFFSKRGAWQKKFENHWISWWIPHLQYWKVLRMLNFTNSNMFCVCPQAEKRSQWCSTADNGHRFSEGWKKYLDFNFQRLGVTSDSGHITQLRIIQFSFIITWEDMPPDDSTTFLATLRVWSDLSACPKLSCSSRVMSSSCC